MWLRLSIFLILFSSIDIRLALQGEISIRRCVRECVHRTGIAGEGQLVHGVHELRQLPEEGF